MPGATAVSTKRSSRTSFALRQRNRCRQASRRSTLSTVTWRRTGGDLSNSYSQSPRTTSTTFTQGHGYQLGQGLPCPGAQQAAPLQWSGGVVVAGLALPGAQQAAPLQWSGGVVVAGLAPARGAASSAPTMAEDGRPVTSLCRFSAAVVQGMPRRRRERLRRRTSHPYRRGWPRVGPAPDHRRPHAQRWC